MVEVATSFCLYFMGWFVWNRRLTALARTERVLGAVSPERTTGPTVTLVVPARNEESNLPTLLESVASLDPAAHQCVVVDDHSTDATERVARDAGVSVVRPEPLPSGWTGKPWACARGAREATGELLLFTDADTAHAPGSLGLAVDHLLATGADLVSVVPTHVNVVWWERLQALFQLLLLVSTRAGAKLREPGERDFCIGQYLLFRRAAYEKVGGHEAVRDRVAEDLAFARLVREKGGSYELLLAPGALRVRMYPEGLGSFVRGWRRNFREGMKSVGAVGLAETVAVLVWLLGAPVCFARGVAAWARGGAPWLALVGGAFTCAALVEIARRQRLVGRFSRLSVLAYPATALVFAWVTLLAAYDRVSNAPVRWRGRVLVRGAA